MKVILLKEVPKVGRMGEIVEVSEGYAKNLLFRRGLAQLVTPQIQAQYDARKNKEIKLSEEKKQESAKIAKLISGQILQFEVKIGKDGGVFTSVHGDDVKNKIIDFIKENGFHAISIDDIQTNLKPVKELGIKNIELKIGRGNNAHNTKIQIEIIGK